MISEMCNLYLALQDITVGVTAADIQTADNEILISTLRELTKAFQIHTLPKLSDWRALMGQTRQHIELDPLYSSIERVIMEVLPLHEECLINLKGRINEFIDSKSNNFFEL